MEALVFYRKKTYYFYLIAISILASFVIGRSLINNLGAVDGAAYRWVFIVFCCLVLCFNAYHIIKSTLILIANNPAITISEHALEYAVSMKKNCTVQLDNLSESSVVRKGNSAQVVIPVKDKTIIEKQLTGMSKMVAENMDEKFGTPLVIKMKSIAVTPEELSQALNERLPN